MTARQDDHGEREPIPVKPVLIMACGTRRKGGRAWAAHNDPIAHGPFLDSLVVSTALANSIGKPDAAGGGLRPPPGGALLVNGGPLAPPVPEPMTFLRYGGIAVRMD